MSVLFPFCRLWSSHSSYYWHHPFRMAFHCLVLISRYLGLTRALLRWRWTITTMIILYTFNLLHPLFQEEMLASFKRSVTFCRLWAAEHDSATWILMKATWHIMKKCSTKKNLEVSYGKRWNLRDTSGNRNEGLHWKLVMSKSIHLNPKS